MKRKILNFTVLLLMSSAIYSQEFYFGFSPGEVSSVYSKSADKYTSNTMFVFQLSGNFIFSTIFKNNLEVETGIMYYPYPYNIKKNIHSSDRAVFKIKIMGENEAYHAFSLPIHLGHKFKLANRLYANIYSGLNFDFYFAPFNTKYRPYKYDENDFWNEASWSRFGDLIYCMENTLKRRFNIMFANRFSLQYFTKFNMGISLYASYYSGLRQVWESHLHYTYDFGETFHKDIFLSRGSFWNFGLELGFKISKESKAQRKESSAARKEQRRKIYELL